MWHSYECKLQILNFNMFRYFCDFTSFWHNTVKVKHYMTLVLGPIYLQNTLKTDFYYLSRFQKSILLLKISLKMILRISPLVLRNQPKSVISIICRSWSLRMTLHELYRSRPISVNFHLCKNHRHTFSHSCFGSIPKVKPIWYSWLLKEEKSVLANFVSL